MFKEFYALLEMYLCTYLPKQRGCSNHTVISYYTSLSQYIAWLSDTGEIKKEKIQISNFTKERVLSWLSSIETNGCTVSTRNQRLAGIRSFLAYAADEDPIYMDTYLQIEKIHMKKGNKPKKHFLSQEEFQEILKSIPSGSRLSIRHYVLLSTLYETGARVQEICDMKPEDFSFGKICSIRIYGKGRKTRIVYISSDMAVMLKDYCIKFSLKEGTLFRNRYGNPLTDSGIDYIIKKYTSIASKHLPSLKQKKVSAHTFRRSKATHMLLSGVSLPVIQRFLGHESIQTTEEYLEIGSEAMIQAVLQSSSSVLTEKEMGEKLKWEDVNILEQIRQKISTS